MSVEDQYLLLHPTYQTFCDRLGKLVEVLIGEAGIKIHALEKRVKDVESFRQKISRPEKRYTDPLRQITDLCGIRIIVYYPQDVQRIANILENEFEVDRENSSDRGAQLKPNEFGYRSHHYIVSLSPNRKTLPEWRNFSDLCAEIQVRTVLQHGWAVISHAMQYKAKSNIPDEISRKLYRVSGLLELADEEFEEINNLNKRQVDDVTDLINKGDLSVPISRISISQYLKKSDTPKLVARYALEAGFSEESDSQEHGVDDISELIEVCHIADLKTVSGLEATCKYNLDLLAKYFDLLISKSNSEWGAPTAWFLTLAVVFIRSSYFDVKVLTDIGWDEEIATIIIESAESLNEQSIS